MALSLPGVATVALDLTAIFTLALLGLMPSQSAPTDESRYPFNVGLAVPGAPKSNLPPTKPHQGSARSKAAGCEGGLKVLPSQPLSDLTLAKEVGLGLAGLLSAASKPKTADGIARYVIRSAPVHCVGSLMEEEADLSAYSEHLCSCQSLVEKLRAKGVLTREEEERALAYIKFHERPWASEPEILDSAEIYLDNLTTTYLQTVGVLAKLKAAGLVAYITEDEDNEANRLISHENLSDQQLGLIELIRKTLADGLASGRVRAVKSPPIGDEKIWDRTRRSPSSGSMKRLVPW